MNRRGNRAALSSLRLSPVVMAVNKKAASQREEETQTVFIILATLQVMRTNPRNFLSTTRGESRLCLCVCVCVELWLHLHARSGVIIGHTAAKDLSGLSSLCAPLVLRDRLT